MKDYKNYWDKIYQTKLPNEVSWTQDIPRTSLDFIHGFGLSKKARIIDIGGGDSRLAECLLVEGYQDITVLDISEKALERAKVRLGQNAGKINWIVSDIIEFKPAEAYDIWHDRATFHFLTTKDQIAAYIDIALKAARAYLTIGTFSETGPSVCSGLNIKQYSEQELQKELAGRFDKIRCITEDHITPFNTKQNFLFCSFKRSANKEQVLFNNRVSN